MLRTVPFVHVFVLLATLVGHAKADILGTAQHFAVLAGSAVTNTGPTVITGNLGVWPGTAITGFPPGLVTGGTIHAADATAMQAQSDVTTAYNTLASMAITADMTGQDLGGLTLTPGVYFFSTSAQLTGTLTLNTLGNPQSVFVFQVGTTLTTASNSVVTTINGSDDCNVYWQVGSSATLGTGTSFQGNILALASITLTTGANIPHGRALARNGAVTLDNVNIVPGCACLLGPTSMDCNMNGIPDECDIPEAFPHFTNCPDSPVATVGVPLTFDVCATSGLGGGPITMTFAGFPIGLPPGSNLSVPLPATGNTVCTTFTWTPTPEQASALIGGVVLEFFATDANGCSALCKMRILVLQTFFLLSPGIGNSHFPIDGHVFDSQLTRLRRAIPVSMDSPASFAYDALPSHYFVQVVTYNPLQYPQQPNRWSCPMEFIKDVPGPGIHVQQMGTVNGIDLSVTTSMDASGHMRVSFPFLIQ